MKLGYIAQLFALVLLVFPLMWADPNVGSDFSDTSTLNNFVKFFANYDAQTGMKSKENVFIKAPLEYSKMTLLNSWKNRTDHDVEKFIDAQGVEWYVKKVEMLELLRGYFASRLMEIFANNSVLAGHTPDVRLFKDLEGYIATKGFANFEQSAQNPTNILLGSALFEAIARMLRIGDRHVFNQGTLNLGNYSVPVVVDMDIGRLLHGMVNSSDLCLGTGGIPVNETMEAIKFLKNISWTSVQRTVQDAFTDFVKTEFGLELGLLEDFRVEVISDVEAGLIEFYNYMELMVNIYEADMHRCDNISVFLNSTNFAKWNRLVPSCDDSFGFASDETENVVYYILASKILKEASKGHLLIGMSMKDTMSECVRDSDDVYGILLAAMQLKYHLAVFDFSAAYGAFLHNATDEQAKKLFFAAVNNGFLDIAQALLASKKIANIDIDEALLGLHDTHGKLDGLFFLLSNGGNPNLTNSKNVSLMHGAVKLNRLDYVKALYHFNASLYMNATEENVIVQAFFYNRLDIAEFLLESVANETTVPDHVLLASLMHATESVPSLQLLLRYNVSLEANIGSHIINGLELACYSANEAVLDFLLNSMPESGPLMLSYAAGMGLKDSLKTLLEKNVDVNAAGKNGRSALSAAMVLGQTEIVSLLLAHPEIDLNIADGDQRMPLHYAVMHGNEEILRLLLSCGKPILLDPKDANGITPLELALLKDHYNVTLLLLQYKVPVDDNSLVAVVFDGLQDLLDSFIIAGAPIHNLFYGQTLLHIALLKERNAVLELLLRRGVDVNGKDQHGDPAIQLAIVKDNIIAVRLLLQYNANIFLIDGDGYNSICLAASHNRTRILGELLLIPGALNTKCSGLPLLHLAIRYESMEMIELLLEKNVNVNEVDDYGVSPITHAILLKNGDIVKRLLRTSVCLDCEDKHGNTPLLYAIASENKSIIKLIRTALRKN